MTSPPAARSIAQVGRKTSVRWGAVGAEGSAAEREHEDEAAAASFAAAKIKEKVQWHL
jgi:predicted DNA-binding WGR domain protein